MGSHDNKPSDESKSNFGNSSDSYSVSNLDFSKRTR